MRGTLDRQLSMLSSLRLSSLSTERSVPAGSSDPSDPGNRGRDAGWSRWRLRRDVCVFGTAVDATGAVVEGDGVDGDGNGFKGRNIGQQRNRAWFEMEAAVYNITRICSLDAAVA